MARLVRKGRRRDPCAIHMYYCRTVRGWPSGLCQDYRHKVGRRRARTYHNLVACPTTCECRRGRVCVCVCVSWPSGMCKLLGSIVYEGGGFANSIINIIRVGKSADLRTQLGAQHLHTSDCCNAYIPLLLLACRLLFKLSQTGICIPAGGPPRSGDMDRTRIATGNLLFKKMNGNIGS